MESGLSIKFFFALLTLVLCCASSKEEAEAAPRYERSVVEIDNPKETLQVLGNLAQQILEAENISNEKRGLDFGLSRGFSGSQAAKHLMGLSAASFANGPGRKRRSIDGDHQ